ERVFDGETENIYKYRGPILIELVNAHSKDSIAIGYLFDELRELLPYKDIDYFRNYTGTPLRAAQGDDPEEINGFGYSNLKIFALTFYITEVESKKEAYTLNDKNFLEAARPNGRYNGSYSQDNKKK